jgi:hypothetical protein
MRAAAVGGGLHGLASLPIPRMSSAVGLPVFRDIRIEAEAVLQP